VGFDILSANGTVVDGSADVADVGITGDELFISPLTVQTHLTNLYGKLGVGGRAEAVALAVRQNIA
jgi:Bacterial regulatory proteins, luxR family